MEKLILLTLNTYKPMPTRSLMNLCKIDELTEEAYDFVSLLKAMEKKGRITRVDGKGWVRV